MNHAAEEVRAFRNITFAPTDPGYAITSAYADLLEQIEQAKAGVTVEIVELAIVKMSAWATENAAPLVCHGSVRSALQSIAHLLPNPPAQAVQVDVEPAEGRCIRVLSCDGEWDVEARWEHGEGAYVTQKPMRPAAEPVAQGEASACDEDNNSLCRKAAGNLSMLLSLCQEQLHPDEYATVQEIICGLQAAQPRVIPNVLNRLLREMVELHDCRGYVLTHHMEKLKAMLTFAPSPGELP